MADRSRQTRQKGAEAGGVVRHVSDAMLSEAFRIKRALIEGDTKRPRQGGELAPR